MNDLSQSLRSQAMTEADQRMRALMAASEERERHNVLLARLDGGAPARHLFCNRYGCERTDAHDHTAKCVTCQDEHITHSTAWESPRFSDDLPFLYISGGVLCDGPRKTCRFPFSEDWEPITTTSTHEEG